MRAGTWADQVKALAASFLHELGEPGVPGEVRPVDGQAQPPLLTGLHAPGG